MGEADPWPFIYWSQTRARERQPLGADEPTEELLSQGDT